MYYITPTMELKTKSKSLLRCKSLALSSEATIINVILKRHEKKLTQLKILLISITREFTG